jgi:preprotein translocase subunit SecY
MEQLERPRSKLYALEPLVRKLPEVSVPKRHISFKEKFIWTGIALIAFFMLTQVTLYGLAEIEPFTDVNLNGVWDPGEPFEDLNMNGRWDGRLPFFGQLRFILASHAGSLMELGIGPIVTAGIVLQLLVGSKILGLDLGQSEDRVLFTGVQKLGAILMGVFQASMLVMAGWYGVPFGSGPGIFIVAQLVIGVIIVVYLDEVVSKYGFGSGISLFIVAGVAGTIVWQAFNPLRLGGVLTGAIPNLFETMLIGGDISGAFFRPGLPNIIGIFATFLVFFIVVYVESIRIEIPLAYGRVGGIRGRYPIKFLYTSVIPVILAMVVFANIQILAGVLNMPGITHFITSPIGIFEVMADPLRAGIYISILVLLSTGFAWMWVNMTGMGPRDVARQLDRSGMMIPGFRRDIRVMEWVLNRYIMTAALLGGAFVGAISAVADFMGAIGTGTGILLAVGIMYSLYQEIAKERVVEMFPAMRGLFGE